MTETNATPASPADPPVPTFPPGRYGRRRDPDRHRWERPAVAVLAVIVLAGGVAVSYLLGQRYGTGRPYEASVERFYDVTDSQVVVEFTVHVPDGEAAVCAVRARAAHGGEVGREEILVDPPEGVTRPRVVHTLPTRERPVTGEVQRCWRDG